MDARCCYGRLFRASPDGPEEWIERLLVSHRGLRGAIYQNPCRVVLRGRRLARMLSVEKSAVINVNVKSAPRWSIRLRTLLTLFGPINLRSVRHPYSNKKQCIEVLSSPTCSTFIFKLYFRTRHGSKTWDIGSEVNDILGNVWYVYVLSLWNYYSLSKQSPLIQYPWLFWQLHQPTRNGHR